MEKYLELAPSPAWAVDVARRAVVYRDNLKRKYEELSQVIDESEDADEVRRAVYQLAGVQDELAKVSWIVGKE